MTGIRAIAGNDRYGGVSVQLTYPHFTSSIYVRHYPEYRCCGTPAGIGGVATGSAPEAPNYGPLRVNPDGWNAPQHAWKTLVPQITVVLWFVHGVLGVHPCVLSLGGVQAGERSALASLSPPQSRAICPTLASLLSRDTRCSTTGITGNGMTLELPSLRS